MKKYTLSRQDLSDCTPLRQEEYVQLHAGDLGTFVHGMHLASRWLRQPGKNIRNSITNYRFLGFFDGLTGSKWFKIDHYCGGFECKMGRVGQILTKLSIAENFKEWTFGQFAWIIGLVTLRITTDRTYLRKDVHYGCF